MDLGKITSKYSKDNPRRFNYGFVYYCELIYVAMLLNV